MADLAPVLADIAGEMAQATDRGEVASYIPELAKVDPRRFGIAVATADGELLAAGDAELPFSIQSVSKVFTLTLALGTVGDALWRRVGREPSGNAFNSIVQLEYEQGIPRNPFINAGAIVVADTLLGAHTPKGALAEILSFVRQIAEDDTIAIDPAVARSEQRTGFRNAALANFLRASGNLHHAPELTLGVYYHHCAIAMTCRQLALAGRYLVNAGKLARDGSRIVSAQRARRVNALMLTCGHYDGSGDFAFRVGLPGKSGVGGAILAIAPKRASIAVWSPGLNRIGNSLLGSKALEKLVKATGWSVFGDL